MKRRLLILSCTERKNDAPELLPAMFRYDGPAFYVLRKFLREKEEVSKTLDVYIISAEYGFIRADFPITNYDRRMNLKRANELRQETLTKIRQVVEAGKHEELF